MKRALNEHLKLAIPNILSNLTVPLAGLVDTVLLGHESTAGPLAGVALAGAIFSFLYWGLIFLRMSTTGLTANAVGAGDEEETVGLFLRSFCLALVLGISILLLSPLIEVVSFYLLQGEPAVEAQGLRYYRARIWGAPAVLGLMAINGWLLGRLKSRQVLLLSIIQNTLIVVLDLVFIKLFGWGSSRCRLCHSPIRWTQLFGRLDDCEMDLGGIAQSQVFHIEPSGAAQRTLCPQRPTLDSQLLSYSDPNKLHQHQRLDGRRGPGSQRDSPAIAALLCLFCGWICLCPGIFGWCCCRLERLDSGPAATQIDPGSFFWDHGSFRYPILAIYESYFARDDHPSGAPQVSVIGSSTLSTGARGRQLRLCLRWFLHWINLGQRNAQFGDLGVAHGISPPSWACHPLSVTGAPVVGLRWLCWPALGVSGLPFETISQATLGALAATLPQELSSLQPKAGLC